jgi:UDP-glucose 4-epimerase
VHVLVTGGAGFIGSALVDELVASGSRCTVIDDLSRGTRENLAHHGDAVRLVEGSVTDGDLVRDVAPGHDAVFHLASVVGVRSTVADPARVIETAVSGTANVMAAADPEAAIVVASSSEVYGRSEAVPFEENMPGLIGSSHNARWSYAHAKSCAEHLALAVNRPLPPSIVRYFNVYGPRMPRRTDPSVVTQFLDAAAEGAPLFLYGGGEQTRSFVFVDDAVRGTLAALHGANGEVVNLGGPHETSIARLAEHIARLSGSRSQIVPTTAPASLGEAGEDPKRRSASGRLAAERLRWKVEVSLEDGLTRTWATWPTNHVSLSRSS